LVGTPIEVREFDDAFVAVPADRSLLSSPTWRALRAVPPGGVGRAPEEALALLAYAAGVAAGGGQRPSAPRAADAWLQEALQRLGGTATVAEITLAARAAGIACTGLRRASARLGVMRSKTGMRAGWTWSLPGTGDSAQSATPAAGEGDQVEIEERAGAAGEGVEDEQ
jgi:hypothetical protein